MVGRDTDLIAELNSFPKEFVTPVLEMMDSEKIWSSERFFDLWKALQDCNVDFFDVESILVGFKEEHWIFSWRPYPGAPLDLFRACNEPHPSKKTITDALGVKPRPVQHRIADLETSGLIRREELSVTSKGSRTTVYNFDGSIAAALPYANEKPQEIEVRDKAKKSAASPRVNAKLRLVKSANETD